MYYARPVLNLTRPHQPCYLLCFDCFFVCCCSYCVLIPCACIYLQSSKGGGSPKEKVCYNALFIIHSSRFWQFSLYRFTQKKVLPDILSWHFDFMVHKWLIFLFLSFFLCGVSQKCHLLLLSIILNILIYCILVECHWIGCNFSTMFFLIQNHR